MRGIQLKSIDQAVGIVETFGNPLFVADSKDPETLLSSLVSIKRWVELTTGRRYSDVAKEIIAKYRNETLQ